MDYNTHSREFNDAIHKLFHGKTTMERAAAANHLGYLKDRRATNSLARAIKKETDPIVLNRIIEAIGELQDPKGTMLIIEILKNELVVPEDKWNKLHLQIIYYGREYSPARGWNLDKDIITKKVGRKSVLKEYYKNKKGL